MKIIWLSLFLFIAAFVLAYFGHGILGVLSMWAAYICRDALEVVA